MRSKTSLKAELFARALRMSILGVFALFVAISVLSLLQPIKTSAAVSSTLNFQTRLETAGGAMVPDGNYNVEFKLYDLSSSSGSSQGSCTGDADCLWTETRTSANQVRVVNGYLTVNLGSVNAFSSTINWNQQLWLTMRIGGTGTPSWDSEMSPRIQLTAVPYSFQAGALGNGINQAMFDSSGNVVFQQASTIKELSATGGTALTIQGGAATAGTNVGGNLLLQGGAGASTGASGSVIVKSNSNNSTTAFQVQNASGAPVLTADTSNGEIILGQTGASGINGQLVLNSATAGNFTTTLVVSSSQTASYTLTLPTSGPSTSQCLQTDSVTASQLKFGSCGAGSSPTLAGVYTNGTSQTDSTINLDSTRLGVIIKDNATPISGALFQVQDAAGGALLLANATSSNLITNPGFEANTTGWGTTGTGTGLAIARNVAAANTYYGYTSLQVTTASGTANTGATVTGFTAALTPGTYTLSFYVMASGSSFSTLNVTTTGGGAPSCVTGVSVSTSGFQRYACIFTTSSTNMTAINFVVSDTAQHVFFLDAVQLASGTALQKPYQLGTTQLRSIVTNPVALQNISNSVTAFQIANTSNNVLFTADTMNQRIGIGLASPAAALDVFAPTSTVGLNVAASSFSTLSSGTGASAPNILTVIGATGQAVNASSGSGTAGAGGGISETAGNGGNVSAALGAATGGNGGNVSISGGAGGSGSNNSLSGLGGSGGNVTISGGASGQSDASASGNLAGNVVLQGGSDSNNLISGSVVVQANTYNSNGTFQIQNTNGANGNLFLANTTTPNLLSNTSFEANASGWAINTGSGSSPARDSSQALYGNYSLNVNTSATLNAGVKTSYLVIASSTYTFSFWAKIASGSFTIQAGFSNGTGFAGETTCSLNTTTVTTSWTRYYCTINTAAVINSPYYLFIRQSDSTSRTWYVDGAQLEQASSPTVYHEGSIQFNGTITGPTVFQNAANTTAALQIQNAAGSQILGIDTANAQVLYGTAGTLGGKLVLYSGTASNANMITITTGNTSASYTLTLPTAVSGNSGYCLKDTNGSGVLGWGACSGSGGTTTITLIPEYIGAVFSQYDATGTSSGTNVGFMQSDHVAGLVSGQGYKHNFYQWSTDQTSAQDYHIVTEYQLPSGFTSFATGTFKIWTYIDSATSTDLKFTMYSASGTACYAALQSIKPASTATWTQTTISDPGNGCTFAAGDVITIDIKMVAIQPSTNYVKVGELQFGYN